MALKDNVPGYLKSNAPFFLWDCVNYAVLAQGLGKNLDTIYTGYNKLNFFIMWLCGVQGLFTHHWESFILSLKMKWMWSGRLKISGTFCNKGPHIRIHSKIDRVRKLVDFMEICFPFKVTTLKKKLWILYNLKKRMLSVSTVNSRP